MRHVAGAIHAQGRLPGGRPAQAEHAGLCSGRTCVETKVRSMASESGCRGSEASTVDVSMVGFGNSASAWENEEGPEIWPTSLTRACALAKPAEVGRGPSEGGVVGIGRRSRSS